MWPDRGGVLRVLSKSSFGGGFENAAVFAVGAGIFGAVATDEKGDDEGGGAAQDDYPAACPVMLHDGGGRGACGAGGGRGWHGLVVTSVPAVVRVLYRFVWWVPSPCIGK